MLNIYITRHGQDLDNEKGILNGHRDNDLSLLGLNQAKELASLIAEKSLIFDKIYSSPLRRAFQTAKIIAEKFHLLFQFLFHLLTKTLFSTTYPPTQKTTAHAGGRLLIRAC